MATYLNTSSAWFYEKDSEVLYLDETNKRAGINTKTPEFDLHVVDDTFSSNITACNILTRNFNTSNLISSNISTTLLSTSNISSSNVTTRILSSSNVTACNITASQSLYGSNLLTSNLIIYRGSNVLDTDGKIDYNKWLKNAPVTTDDNGVIVIPIPIITYINTNTNTNLGGGDDGDSDPTLDSNSIYANWNNIVHKPIYQNRGDERIGFGSNIYIESKSKIYGLNKLEMIPYDDGKYRRLATTLESDDLWYDFETKTMNLWDINCDFDIITSNLVSSNVNSKFINGSNLNVANITASNAVNCQTLNTSNITSQLATFNNVTVLSNLTSSNVNSSNLFASNIDTRNLTSQFCTFSNVTVLSNLSSSNISSSNIFASNIDTRNLTSQIASFSNVSVLYSLTSSNVSSSNIFASNIDTRSITTSNAIASNISCNFITTTSLQVTTANVITTLTVPTIFGSNITGCNISTSNLSSRLANFSNVITSNVSTNNITTNNIISTFGLFSNIGTSNFTTSNLITSNLSSRLATFSNVITDNVSTSNLITNSLISQIGTFTSNIVANNISASNITVHRDVRCDYLRATSGVFVNNIKVIEEDNKIDWNKVKNAPPIAASASNDIVYIGDSNQNVNIGNVLFGAIAGALAGAAVSVAGNKLFSQEGKIASDLISELNDLTGNTDTADDNTDTSTQDSNIQLHWSSVVWKPIHTHSNFEIGFRSNVFFNQQTKLCTVNPSIDYSIASGGKYKGLSRPYATSNVIIDFSNLTANLSFVNARSNVITSNILTSNITSSIGINTSNVTCSNLSSIFINTSNHTASNLRIGNFYVNSSGLYVGDPSNPFTSVQILDTNGDYKRNIYISQIVDLDSLNMQRLADGALITNPIMESIPSLGDMNFYLNPFANTF